VCRACGTRIKAGREFCLKCFEPLPHPDAPVPVPLSESLGLSERSQMLAGGAVLVIVVALIGVIWTSEKPVVEDSAAAPSAAPSKPAAAASTAAAPVSAPAAAPDAATAVAGSDNAPPMPPLPEVVKADPDTPVDPALAQQVEQYRAQLTRLPNDAVAHNKLALVLAQSGENDEALKEFERAIAAAPREPAYRVNLANLALANGDLGRAINQYRETILLKRTDFAAQFGLAVA
jgi:type IV secretory pathway VirB10-like protein